jgi:hypothetical protein
MGAVALGQQLNTDNRTSKAARRKGQAPDPPRQIKDTTRTRYNAIRHGILARSVVLEGEDPQMYEDLRTALGKDLEVVGMVEEMWLDQLVSCYWRQQRILRAEAEPEAKLEVLHRYEVGLRNEMKGAIAEIREAQRIRRRGYPADAEDARRDEHRAETAARHEARFWEAVQEDFDGPQPAPAPPAEQPAEVRPVAPVPVAESVAVAEVAPEPVPEAVAPAPPVHCETNSRREGVQGGGMSLDALVRAAIESQEGLMSRREGL